MRSARTRTTRTPEAGHEIGATLLAAVVALVLAGCDGQSSTTGGQSQSPKDRGGENLLETRDLTKVPGYQEKAPEVRPVGDVRFSLYDIGKGKTGISKTTIHIFPRSSLKYRRTATLEEGAIIKIIPDQDMRDLLEAADQAKFMSMMRPMTRAEVQSSIASGDSVITLESPNGMRGVARPRIRAGATEKELQLFSDMEKTFLYFAEEYRTPIVVGGSGPGREFKQPERRP